MPWSWQRAENVGCYPKFGQLLRQRPGRPTATGIGGGTAWLSAAARPQATRYDAAPLIFFI